MTIKITQLGNLTSVYGNTIVPVVANIAGTLTTVKGNLDQLTAYIISSTEANIVLANTNIKSYVDGQVSAVNTSVTLANTIQSQQIAAANVGIIGYIDQANTIQSAQLLSANVGIIGYIDQANTIQSAQIAAANVGIIGYIDQANTIQNAYVNGQITAANAGVTAANVGMKGYVDAQTYSNIQVSNFLPTYSTGNIGVLSITPNLVSVFSAVAIGFPSTISFANVIISGTNDVNGYSQLNVQNTNTFGNLVSADFIATAPNGTDSANYIDMGINGNNYSQVSWTISGANDGYVYINGGNLTLGTDTADKTVKIHTGGTLADNVITTFADTGVSIHGNLFVSNTYVPALANSVGTTGQITYDNNYVYVCIATDNWRRANLAAW